MREWHRVPVSEPNRAFARRPSCRNNDKGDDDDEDPTKFDQRGSNLDFTKKLYSNNIDGTNDDAKHGDPGCSRHGIRPEREDCHDTLSIGKELV